MEKTNDLSFISLLMLGAMLDRQNEEPKPVEKNNTGVRFKNPVKVGDNLEIIGQKDDALIVRLNGSESYVPVKAWSTEILLQVCLAYFE